jgi:hypothetical protein
MARKATRALVMTLVMTLLMALLMALPVTAAQAGQGVREFPPTIGALKLVKLLTQGQARDSLNSIHDEKIEVAQAAIAYYEGEPGKAVVWWSRAANDAQAGDQLDRMVSKIKQFGYNYRDCREFSRNGIKVYSLSGKGQLHYTWRQGDQVLWIQAPAGLIEAVFDAVAR